MAVSRRAFVQAIGSGGVGLLSTSLIAARGSEAAAGGGWGVQDVPAAALRLNSNENPLGPGPAALRALAAAVGDASRYPAKAGNILPEAIAAAHGVAADRVMPACGSGEVLRVAVQAFCSPSRPLVTALPTFETCTNTAKFHKYPLHEVPVGADLGLDLETMAQKAAGAGLVFLCNPNNPTGTVYGAAVIEGFVDRVRKASPDTIILIDEAYHEYVEAPAYATALPLALAYPQVVVVRTCSKVHGMAGLRIGYALGQPATLERMAAWRMVNGQNILGIHAAAAAFGDHAHIERARAANREAREYTRRLFVDLGFTVADSHTNFVLADLRRDAADFAKACRADGVLVGRPFPPLTTWTRVSIGTMAEMERAASVFKRILRSA